MTEISYSETSSYRLGGVPAWTISVSSSGAVPLSTGVIQRSALHSIHLNRVSSRLRFQ